SHSMLSNLIKNAVEASAKGDVVTVDCRQSSEYTVVRVHNPSEVPEDIRGTFFDKYATSGKKFGTGLGTYSARLTADIHGADIRVHASDAADITRITIHWPAA
ncbi:MAG: ATP-binding protein, partial [Desulfobacterales bacterium]|nr:ATP-binding protein [Desulfobacterales bacterium]